MKNPTIEIIFLSDDQIEIIVDNTVYLALEEKAKLKGVSVECLLSVELLRVR